MKELGMIMARGRGKVWMRSAEAASRRVVESEDYFIRRHGGWFRPEACGYTNELSDAGVFVGAIAKKYLQAEGVSLHPVSAMVPQLAKLVRDHIVKADVLAKLIESY